LSLETYRPSWNASCSRPESCTECPALITTKSRYMLQATSQSDPATLIAFLPIHLQGDDQYKCGKLHLGSLYRALETYVQFWCFKMSAITCVSWVSGDIVRAKYG
jgi:hypothetical protein